MCLHLPSFLSKPMTFQVIAVLILHWHRFPTLQLSNVDPMPIALQGGFLAANWDFNLKCPASWTEQFLCSLPFQHTDGMQTYNLLGLPLGKPNLIYACFGISRCFENQEWGLFDADISGSFEDLSFKGNWRHFDSSEKNRSQENVDAKTTVLSSKGNKK